MARTFRTRIWQVRLPTGWSSWQDQEQRMVTFFRPDGVGLLTIFTPDEDAEEKPHPRSLSVPPSPETSTQIIADGYRQTWAYTCHGRKLSIRYVCAQKNAGLENKEVEAIVDSIEESDLY